MIWEGYLRAFFQIERRFLLSFASLKGKRSFDFCRTWVFRSPMSNLCFISIHLFHPISTQMHPWVSIRLWAKNLGQTFAFILAHLLFAFHLQLDILLNGGENHGPSLVQWRSEVSAFISEVILALIFLLIIRSLAISSFHSREHFN